MSAVDIFVHLHERWHLWSLFIDHIEPIQLQLNIEMMSLCTTISIKQHMYSDEIAAFFDATCKWFHSLFFYIFHCCTYWATKMRFLNRNAKQKNLFRSTRITSRSTKQNSILDWYEATTTKMRWCCTVRDKRHNSRQKIDSQFLFIFPWLQKASIDNRS